MAPEDVLATDYDISIDYFEKMADYDVMCSNLNYSKNLFSKTN